MAKLIGTSASELIEGTRADDIIAGRPGDDTLVGNGGYDYLAGNAGDDTLIEGNIAIGGAGNDIFEWTTNNRGYLRYDLEGGNGDINADLDNGIVNDTHGDADFVDTTFMAGIVGSLLDDSITTTDPDIAVIGHAGDDTLDAPFVDYGREDAIGGGGGVIVNLIVGSAIDTVGDDDTLMNVTTLNLTGDADDVVGGGADETIMGNGGDDTIDASGGDDMIDGGNGDDSILGGRGDDMLTGGRYGTDELNGNGGADTLMGGGESDTLFGGKGGDELFGQAGSDLLRGGTNRDHLFGGNAGDFLFGDEGRDTLEGGSGNDELDGGAGIDLLFGGAGADTFIFSQNAPGAPDVVSDFQEGIDTVLVDADLYDDPIDVILGETFLLDVNPNGGMTDEATLVYQTGAGRLYLDVDGSGDEAAVFIASFDGAPNLTAEDIQIV